MPHQRSVFALQRRAAKRFCMDHAFNDFLIAEKVNRSTPNEIITFLQEQFPNSPVEYYPDVFPGVVLSDSRGQGAFQ